MYSIIAPSIFYDKMVRCLKERTHINYTTAVYDKTALNKSVKVEILENERRELYDYDCFPDYLEIQCKANEFVDQMKRNDIIKCSFMDRFLKYRDFQSIWLLCNNENEIENYILENPKIYKVCSIVLLYDSLKYRWIEDGASFILYDNFDFSVRVNSLYSRQVEEFVNAYGFSLFNNKKLSNEYSLLSFEFDKIPRNVSGYKVTENISNICHIYLPGRPEPYIFETQTPDDYFFTNDYYIEGKHYLTKYQYRYEDKTDIFPIEIID